MEGSGKYYLISHLVLLTGLTDRTIRKYISSGILQGEKIDGLWHFTPEQVEGFVRHPAVRLPECSIRKSNARLPTSKLISARSPWYLP